jgi:tRNA pseudouridine55 synthase
MAELLEKVSSPEHGILLIDKPYGWTSFQVVKKIRYLLQKKFDVKKLKVGHAGTLDPLATGLLIVCYGKETKNIQQYQLLEKEYSGCFYLGATTACFDREKEVDNTFDISHITEKEILAVAQTFLGKQMQVAPLFSAKKIDGKKAYEIARAGNEKEIKANEIEIMSFEITQIKLPLVYFKIVCSKGTYIRSMVRDFGEKLHSGAFLYDLKRERIGHYFPEITIETTEKDITLKPSITKNTVIIK